MASEVWYPPPECSECAQGKCRNCTGEAVDPVTKKLVQCGCLRRHKEKR